MKLIDLLTPLLILADLACREYARRTGRDVSAPMIEASTQQAPQQPGDPEVRTYAGIYIRDDEH